MKKKFTIFRMFLIPLITIMLIQSVIIIGTLVAMGTARTLEEYASGMMRRLVENRQVVLQNEMNQRWGSIKEQEEVITGLLEEFLAQEGIGVEELMMSHEKRNRLLEQLFPECLDILQGNSTTGLFLVLTDGRNIHTAGEYDGFFLRDSDPYKSPVNYSDFLLERGNKQLSQEWNIPLDSNWTTYFHMDGQGQNDADNFFYEPWRAGQEYPEADTEDLGYWSLPFSLGKDRVDPHEMITYSLPLRYMGQTYGVLGVEISCRSLYDYFPVAELNKNQQAGYMLAIQEERCVPLTGKGILYDLVRSSGDSFELEEMAYDNLSLVRDVRLNGQKVYAVACPLKLYSNNVPYENTHWVLLGLNTEEELFGLSRQLYGWMMVAVSAGLIFGVFGIYLIVRHLIRPVQRLMQCIREGETGLQNFKHSNIMEIDALYDVVVNLTKQQKKAENILLAEKERYKVALESTEDIFFTYDLQSQMLDVVNHPTMSGQWECPRTENGFAYSDFIHEDDRAETIRVLRQTPDSPYAEFRLRWPQEAEFTWVALSGKAVRDTDGERWKIVGSIRNIQEQKEKEAEERRKNTMDGTTGLYNFSAGVEQLEKCRREQPEGMMVNLLLDRLRQANEKNGTVFGDMILEEAGVLIRKRCEDLGRETGGRTVALRLNEEEFALWLEGVSQERAARFVGELLERAAVLFPDKDFYVRMCAGLASGTLVRDSRELIRMAKLARGLVRSDDEHPYLFYEETMSNTPLPPMREREINGMNYCENVSLVSMALDLFGKGPDFHAQMMLLLRKMDRFYQAGGVLLSLLRADFNSNYLEYQWCRNGRIADENVRNYQEEEKTSFFQWLDQKEARCFSPEDSQDSVIQRFLSVMPGQQGITLPLYDSGNYIGNICILDVPPQLLENPEEEQNLIELGQVIQGQLSQQQHDIASKAKSEFLSRMSHEIRTPMNGIIGMTAIALQQDQEPERVMECLQKIRSSSNYLLGLINDILDMSKIESGKMKLEPINFNMNEMLDTIQDLISPQMAAKEVRYVQHIELRNTWFQADRVRISQVLINLLGNAVKFTPAKGQVTLTVQESAAGGENSVVYFAVSDTGVGIAKEDQSRVFRSFEQVAGANSFKQQGTGLGLSISNRLIQMMGSNIQLNSEPGEGSTFSFSIPMTLGHQEGEVKQEEILSFDGFRILVVEDNELNAEIAQCLLEERNFEVEWVCDGAKAVERIRSTPPGTYDVILMDIMMPVMDGLEATKAIRGMDREDCRTIPVIAMSANAFDDDLKKSVECGMNGHLSKPVDVDKLYQTLNQVIRGRKKQHH
ncbi:MAG: response regulator [Lachnospiraceae bacterium]|nr:response regulator [Lachnospiraceae bacterium]